MGMMAPPLAAPPSATPTPEFGPPSPSNTALPAPAQPPSPGATQVLADVHSIVTSARSIAQQFPSTVPIVKQINDLVQQLQIKIVQALPPTEAPAPPV